MKISCPNPSCCQHLSGPRALMGRRFSCPACGHSFIWTDCFHAGDSFVIYDLETTGLYHGVKSRLGLRDTAMRRHDARGDVDLLGRALAWKNGMRVMATSSAGQLCQVINASKPQVIAVVTANINTAAATYDPVDTEIAIAVVQDGLDPAAILQLRDL